jgi:hypothetical protein
MYPYLTLFYKFKDQYILEGCLESKNFKILIKYNYLFDEFDILHQFVSKNEVTDEKYSLYDLIKYKLLNDDIIFRISKILFDKMNSEIISNLSLIN